MAAQRSLWSRAVELLRKEWDWWMQAARARPHLDPGRCIGCWTCREVCPVGCFRQDLRLAVSQLAAPERCVACGACALQCPTGAATLA